MRDQLGRLVRIAVCVAMVGMLIPGFAVASESGTVTKAAGTVAPPPGTIGSIDAVLGGPPASGPVDDLSVAGAPSGTASPVGTTPSDSEKDLAQYAAGQVLVRFKSGVGAAAITSANVRVGAVTITSLNTVSGLQLVQLTGSSVEQAIAKYETMSQVAYAEPNRVIRLAALDPNDPSYADQWHLKNTGQTGGTSDADIDADEAWSYVTGSDATVVAVIDTGVDISHSDLTDNIYVNAGEIAGDGIDNDGNGYTDDVSGWDTYFDSGDVSDGQEHGTHVAGIIGAQGNNSVGVSGVDWDVSILPVKAFNPWGYAYESDLLEGFAYASTMGASVVNCSWGWGSGWSQSMYDAMAALPDTLFVCAAGNGGSDQIGDDNDVDPFYPSSFDLPNILAVGATDATDATTTFSNYGATTVDVFAPGDDVLSTIPSLKALDRLNDPEKVRDAFNTIADWAADAANSPAGVAWDLASAYSWSGPTSMARLDYGNNERNYMVRSTPLDLSTADSPAMHFRLGYSLEYSFDYVYWGVYDAGTSTWYELSPSADGLTGRHETGWSTDIVADLSPWVGHNDVYPYVGLTSDGSVSPGDGATQYWGAWVDDFVVTDAFPGFQDSFATSAGWSVYGNYGAPNRWVWDGGNGANGNAANFGCWKANPYADNEWTSITQTTGIDLTGLDAVTLDFWTYYYVESGWDYLWVQASTDGGAGWTTLANWSGSSGGWSHKFVSLNSFVDNPDVRLRFVLTADSIIASNYGYSGAWVDEMSVSAPLGTWQQSSTDRYEYFSGTSMAAPVASGVAGLLLSRYPAMTTAGLKTAILNGAEPVTGLSGLCTTGARVNAMGSIADTNVAPVGVADAFSCDEDGAIVDNVLANDTDADGDTMTATKLTDPANGVLNLNTDGSFDYTPDPDWNGSDSFTYLATDGIGDSASTTVDLTVNPVNDAPVAVDDSDSCDEDTSVIVDVLANDSDVDNDPLTVVKMSDPANGTAVVNADNTVTYTPNPDWYGTDSFTYLVNDGTADSGTVTVSIDVYNTAVAADDAYKVQTNGMLAVPAPGVLANDGAGDGLWLVKDSNPANGALSLNPDGSFIYVPNVNFVGTDTFTYHATDGLIDTNVVTVTLDVRPFGPPVDNAQGVIYRFYNIKTGAHFYTLSLQERNEVLQKYQGVFCYEGPAFWSFAAEGTIPVHRFFNMVTGSHFYTASESEKAMVQTLWPYIYRYEGTAFHVYTTAGAGRVPVYRFWSPMTGLHFYTASASEKANVEATLSKYWKYEGVGFYVLDGSAF